MTLTVLAVTLALADPQSIGELAKKTAAERDARAMAAKGKEPAADAKPKKYTNEDLKDLKPMPAMAPASVEPAKPQPTSTAGAELDAKVASAKKDEPYWKDRMRVLEDRMAADTAAHVSASTRLRDYERQVNATREYLNGIAYVDRTLQQQMLFAKDEVSRLDAVLAADKIAITSLEEEARRASVPPGWLRR